MCFEVRLEIRPNMPVIGGSLGSAALWQYCFPRKNMEDPQHLLSSKG